MRKTGALRIDRGLLVVLLVICLLGLYNISSAGRAVDDDLYLKQAAYMGVGLCLAVLAAAIDYRNLEGLAIPIYSLVVFLLVLTLVAGKVVKGSRRWLGVGPLALQTSDLAKLGVVLIMAKILHLEKSGRLTLRELFRPMNVSRPLLAVAAVLAVTVLGDRLSPPALKQQVGMRSRTVAKLEAKAPLVRVGRAQTAQLQLAGANLEPEHAQLVRVEDGTYVLRDGGTAPGVYVNGQRVEGERELHHGDVLRFGLSPRSEVTFNAPLERLRPVRTWLAVLSTLWLLAAVVLQIRKGHVTARDLVAPIDGVVLPAALVLVQPDLGTASIVVLVALSIVVYVGLETVSLVALAGGSVGAAALAWQFMLKPYQKQRVLTFLDPEADLSGAGYHQNQSLIAIGSGGTLGKGHGQGTQTQLSFLPEQQTDFIFSVWSEEHGFVGCAVVVVLFAALVWLSFRVAMTAKDRFGALLAAGMTAMIFWHAVINMLMVLHLAPVVGVPLPFWSYGGSFMLTAMVAMGVIMNVAMRRYLF
jgi:cell division protein FtsW (lipid II flippase)